MFGKKLVSLLLVLTMVFSMLPAMAGATETDTQTTVDSGEVTVEGTNSFGNLLSEEITESQESADQAAEGYEAGYSVTDLVIEGNVATVTYDTLETANLVVAIYTEDGLQLVTSGNATVEPEETTATVTIGGEMPQYFMAAAYLLDTYDMSPLCPAYDTPMYTQDMQELLASTVEDYEADRVLQLDDDTTTNFAVYADSTKVIEYVEGFNVVASADDETATYVIENADQQITGLTAGDVFVYAYSEDQMLIVKVDTITLDGTTATITGAEVELEEVFSHVKIEGTMGTDGVEIDDSAAGDGMSYGGKYEVDENGDVIEETTPPVRLDGGFSRETRAKFAYEFVDTDHVDVKVELDIGTKVSFEYYITMAHQRVEFSVEFGGKIEFEVEVSAESKPIKVPIGTLRFPVLPGITVAFTPSFVAEFAISVKGSAECITTLGFGLEHDKNGTRFLNLCKSPEVSASVELEGKISLGFELKPAVKVLEGALADAEIAGKAMVVVTGTLAKLEKDDGSSEHDCIGCVDGKISFKFEVTPSVQFLKSGKLKFSTELVNLTWDITDFYFCIQHLENGFGQCPHISYRATVQVVGSKSNPIANAEVMFDDTSCGKTNESGVLIHYVPAGTHTIKIVSDEASISNSITVTDATKVIINIDDDTIVSNRPGTAVDGSDYIGSLDTDRKDNLTDYSTMSDISIGDTITLGTYNGEPIVWRCVAIDENGPLMLSDKILCFKSFDAKGSHGNYYRNKEGTNNWKVSCIRYWLNASGNVDWASRPATPNVNNVFSGYNPYSEEVGFLSSFSDAELACIKKVKNKTYLNELDKSLADGGSSEYYTPTGSFSSYIQNIGSYGTGKWYQYTEDYVFLLSNEQLVAAYANVGADVLAGIPTEKAVENDTSGKTSVDSQYVWWGRTPGTPGMSYELVCAVDSNGTGCGYRSALSVLHATDYQSVGVRPAFYLNVVDDNTIVASGDCGAEGDNVQWRLSGDGTLTITGTGAMVDYAIPKDSPWLRNDQIKAVKIGESVTKIGNNAFFACSNIKNISFPSSLSAIGDRAFMHCIGLENLTLPSGLTDIGYAAFWGCSSITSIVIPDSVSNISAGILSGCSNLHTISVTAQNMNYCVDSQGILYDKSKTTLIAVPGTISSVTIPDTVTTITDGAFNRCKNLSSIVVPDNVLNLGTYTFTECVNLESIKLPSNLTNLNDEMFYGCSKLSKIIIPQNVQIIGDLVFLNCTALNEVVFQGNAPQEISALSPFRGVTATAYYPANNPTWTAGVMQDYGGTITWVPYTPADAVATKKPATKSIFGGDYSTEVQEEYVLKTAAFSDLAPGKDYVLLALADIEGEDLLTADNVLYIDQGTAGEDGTLTFQYVQRVDTDTAYVMACGASNWDLNDATITFPPMIADEETKVVNPTVVYDGKTLVEGRDYVITGTVDYTEVGTYTCYIRGIYDYTGTVECSYDVTTLADLGFKFNTAAPAISDDIVMNIATTIPEGFAEPYMVVEFNGATTTLTDYTINESNGRYVFAFAGINPQTMGDTFVATLYAKYEGVDVSVNLEYSMLKYINSQLKKSTISDELRTALSDLVMYGEANQVYEGYKTDALLSDLLESTATLTPSTFPGLDDSYNAQTTSGTKDANIDLKGVSMILGSKVMVRMTTYCADPSAYSVKVNIGELEYTYAVADLALAEGYTDRYVVAFDQIKATQFGDVITFSFLDADGNQVGRTLTYSVYTYVQKNQANSDANLVALLEALYNYGQAVKNI